MESKLNQYAKDSMECSRQVSIVILTMNAPTLNACISSILTRTAIGYELVVVCDEPTNERRWNLETLLYQHSARVHINNDRVGIPKAFNQGIALATRPYVMLMNDDVEVRTSDWLTPLVRAMNRNPEHGMISPRATYMDRTEGGYYAAISEASLISRACLDKVGLFNEAPEYRRIGVDGDYWARMMQAGYSPRGIDESVIFHHVGRTITCEANPLTREECEIVTKKLEAEYGDLVKADQHRFPPYKPRAVFQPIVHAAGVTEPMPAAPIRVLPKAPPPPAVPHRQEAILGTLLYKSEGKQNATPVVVRDSKLRVAILSGALIPVPPSGYGGLERVVYDLAVALAQQDVDVTLFAPDGSYAEGCKVVEFGPAPMKVNVNWLEEETKRYERVKAQLADGFDIIHSHDWFGVGYKTRMANPGVKVCHTHHGGMDPRWWCSSKPPFPTNIFGISEWMSRVYGSQGISSKPVYNGVSLEKYKYQERKGDRLCFVGRASTFKQPHVAVEVARRLNMPIDLVCGTFVDSDEYMARLKAQCDGQMVRWVEDPPQDEKVRIMQNAKCILFPSHMGEPFGLVPAEAMACGTPVIALEDGAVSEVIHDGITGYVVPGTYDSENKLTSGSIDLLCDAIKQIGNISPVDCRARVERLFARETMARNYIRHYKDILAGREW